MFGDGYMQCYFNPTGSAGPAYGEGSTKTKAAERNLERCNEDNIDLDMTCCICFENFLVGNPKPKLEVKAALLVQCGHFYHEKCMNNWINSKDRDKRSCPTCRTEVTYDMEIQILPVDLLLENRNSIIQLRQKHAFRRKLHKSAELEQQNQEYESDQDEADEELASTDWVHISLHPMENTDPIAIQHSHTSSFSSRPCSPFTIITADEIPTGGDMEIGDSQRPTPNSTPNSSSPSQHTQSPFESDDFHNFFLRIENNILCMPTPYLNPYDNWLTLR